MTDQDSFDRVRAVDLLWAFKRRCDALGAQGMPMVHFRMLLGDPAYRSEVLTRARGFDDAELRAFAAQLEALPEGAVLADTRNAASDRRHAETAASVGQGWMQRPLRTLAPAALLVVLGLASVVLFGLSGKQEVVVPDQIRSDTTWKAGKTYILTSRSFVQNGAVLTIEPGVIIQGRPGSALIVTRGARLYASGKREAPIVFTSASPAGRRRAGDWGGLVLLGDASINREGARIEGIEADDPRAAFGGRNDDGSCGVLDHVRIEFAGYELMRNVELNGLTLGGCGRNTIVRNVQVHRALDDGIEVFGGTVDLSRIVITGAHDDGFDWDMGWRGRVQHLIVQLHPDIGDNAFEGDNDAEQPDAEPRSAPTFSNVTLIADRGSQRAHRAMTIRQGSAGVFRNVLITGFNNEAIDLRGDGLAQLAASNVLQFGGIAVHASGVHPRNPFPEERAEQDDDGGFSEADFLLGQGRVSVVSDSGLPLQASSPIEPDFTAQRSVPDPAPSAVPQGEFWNEGANYIGAVRPQSREPWFAGWTAFPRD
ncbi:hypothetical protein [Algiphilus sp.]|uniref:hypothetical protein n=1 Tax=Algiphilus sp. TaxID=1872431 RepID=UPI003B52DA04